jgi:predicted MFS family arabinose efflux permease
MRGAVVAWNLRLTLTIMPLLISLFAAGLVVVGSVPLGGGGLFVATTQLAITLGAAAGGMTIDRSGAVSVVVVSGIVLVLATLVTALGLRARSVSPASQTASERSS